MLEKLNNLIAGDAPVFFMIAGPNGAGKSTYRKKLFDPVGLACIDPDEIALQMLGRHSGTREEALEATKKATKIVEQYFSQGDSVALESVFSDTKGHKLDLLKKARNVGYKTCLIFIGLESSQLCIARVIDRVENGGHDVPDELIEDRYQKCFKNLVKASSMVDAVLLVDNSSLESHREFGYFEDNQFLFVSGFVPLWFESVKEAFL